jgi:hypothetical protein
MSEFPGMSEVGSPRTGGFHVALDRVEPLGKWRVCCCPCLFQQLWKANLLSKASLAKWNLSLAPLVWEVSVFLNHDASKVFSWIIFPLRWRGALKLTWCWTWPRNGHPWGTWLLASVLWRHPAHCYPVQSLFFLLMCWETQKDLSVFKSATDFGAEYLEFCPF